MNGRRLLEDFRAAPQLHRQSVSLRALRYLHTVATISHVPMGRGEAAR